MKPVDFKGSNVKIAEHQEEYQTLPALVLPDGNVYSCWELDDDEIERLIKTKKLYISQMTFNYPL